jgi:uncharacterized membrane protein
MPRRKAPTKTKRRAVKKPATVHIDHAVPTANIFNARLRRRKSPFERMADFMIGFFGTVTFLTTNFSVFVIWILLNLDILPGVTPFDPYPFGFLTFLVSLEAIALSIIVLISQNRSAKINETREEVDFQIDLQAEKQISAIMYSLEKVLHHLKIDHTEDDDGMQPIDLEKLERRVIHDIDTD